MLIYTNTKSRVKAKQKPRHEREEYEQWCKKHGIDPTGNKRKKEKVSIPYIPGVVTSSPVRQTKHYPSLNSNVTGPCSSGEKKVYTGDKILGIAAMHKSNLVPIFDDQSAKDVSQMRR